MDSLLRYRSLVREAAALRSGADDPVAAARRTCDRIDAVDPHLLAFVPEPDRRARLLAAAERTAAAWDGPVRPPLYGVPVGVKDIIRVDGLPTRAGSLLPPGVLAGPQAAVVDRLVAAGALIAGKTVTAEFAVTAPGPTRNPHHVAHTPGGSSSGSAAAVAAGLVPLALGTQTVGSMIRPAAYCGIVGFKPSFDRVPTAGVIPNAVSFDTVGWYAQDVAGAALAASVLCDHRPDGTDAPPAAAPVLGVPAGPYLRRADDEALAALRAQREVLRRAGYTVVEVAVMADFEEIVTQLFTMNRYEVARAHTEWYARFGDLYREQTATALHEGHAVTDSAYAAACARRAEFREQLDAARRAAGVDLWIAPAATGPAPFGLGSTGTSVMCLPWSNAGLPSVSLPAGRAANGLPLGLQLVGPYGADPAVLTWAAGIEEALRAGGAVPAGGAGEG